MIIFKQKLIRKLDIKINISNSNFKEEYLPRKSTNRDPIEDRFRNVGEINKITFDRLPMNGPSRESYDSGEKEKRNRERGGCTPRPAINVNHLADAQFNKKGHYDRELEVTSTEETLSLLFLGHPIGNSRRNPSRAMRKALMVYRKKTRLR